MIYNILVSLKVERDGARLTFKGARLKVPATLFLEYGVN